MLNGLLDDVAKATSLREGPQGVARILRGVHAAHVVPLKDLAVSCGIPLPVVAAVRRELEKRGLLAREHGGLALTGRGREFVEFELLLRTRHDPICPTCQGRTIVIGNDVKPLIEKMGKYFAAVPLLDTTLDQAPCLPETSVRRALFMYHSGALEGKDVLFLGDDDSISIAVALLGPSLGNATLARRLTVIDADQRFLEHISAVSQAESLGIECVRHDLHEPLPTSLRGQYDTLETDPPYTANGLALFVSRGITGLRSGIGQQAFVSFGAKSPDEALAAMEPLISMGLSPAQILPGFNRYEGASIIGGVSQLIHLQTTSSTAPVIGEDEPYTDPMYTGEAAPTSRLYRCLGCGTDVLVGQGQALMTIEKLKARGCLECGNATFSYRGRLRAI